MHSISLASSAFEPHPREYLIRGSSTSNLMPRTSHNASAAFIPPVDVGFPSSNTGFRSGNTVSESLTENIGVDRSYLCVKAHAGSHSSDPCCRIYFVCLDLNEMSATPGGIGVVRSSVYFLRLIQKSPCRLFFCEIFVPE